MLLSPMLSRSRATRSVALLALAAMPSLARAHTTLKRSEPSKASRLTVPPVRIALWFTAKPQLAFTKIRLEGPAGDVPLGPVAADTGNALVAPISQPLPAGTYTIRWQTASADGHPIRGEFTFSVIGSVANPAMPAIPGGGAAPDVDSAHLAHTPQPETHLEHAEYRSVRWMEFVALMALLGVLGFRHAVLPPLAVRGVPTADAADRARRLGLAALVVYGIAALVRLYTESVAVHGNAEALAMAQLLPMLRTSWGIGWTLGIAGALLLFVGWVLSKRSVTLGTPLALAGALGIVLSPALSGHAISGSPRAVSIGLDVLHVTAAGLWLGGLLMVLIAGIPAMKRLPEPDRDAAVASLVNSFHPLALFCAPIVVFTGLAASWMRLGAIPPLWGTDYGRTLFFKVGLFAVVASIGAHNWLRAKRRLGVAEGTRRFRVSGALELLFAALVLAATTILIVTPIPAELLK
jgi:copper transport protein